MGAIERRVRERNEIREKIMNAARELFAQQGIEAVSMRKVAEAVEYSTAIIYSHFADKQALLREICLADFAALAETFVHLAGVADPMDRIREIGLAYARFGLDHPNQYRLMFMTPHEPVLSKDDLQAVGKGNPDQDGYAFLRATVQEAIASGRLRKELTDADEVCQILWPAVHGMVSLQIIKGCDGWLEWRPFELRMGMLLDWLAGGMSSAQQMGGGA